MILLIFPSSGNKWKKKNLIIMKKKKNYLVQNLDGLLPTGWTRHRARRRGAAGRWGAQAGLGAGRWARGRVAGGWARRARAGSGTARALQATGARACGAGAGRRRGAQARGAGAGRRRGAQARARGQLGGRRARGRAAGVGAGRWAWARGLGAAWAPGLALGSALGALGPFSIRFDSFFFLSHQMNTVHCKIKIFFRKKKIIFIKFK